jgi:chromosome segregation ATPase
MSNVINIHSNGKAYPHSSSSFGAGCISPQERKTQEIVHALLQEVKCLKDEVEELKKQTGKNKDNLFQLNGSVIAEKEKIEGQLASLQSETTNSRSDIYNLQGYYNGLQFQVGLLNQAVFNPMHYIEVLLNEGDRT